MRKGQTASPETRAKISASMTGKTLSAETRSKISKSNLEYYARVTGVPLAEPEPDLFAVLRERDGDTCQLCLEKIDFTILGRDRLARTIDHIVPRRCGGSDELSNLWLAHRTCNQSKGPRYIGRKDGSTDIRRIPENFTILG